MSASLRPLAMRELRELLATSWFIGPALVALLLTPFTVYIGLVDYRSRDLDHTEYVKRIEEARQGGLRTLTGNQLEPALRVVRPPSPGSVIVRGLDDLVAPYWDLAPAGAKTAPSRQSSATIYESGAAFDLGFLLRTVIGLIAIVLGASSIARDQRRGTLRTMFAAPVTPRLLLVGRIVGGALLLAVLIVLVISLGAATIVLVDRPIASTELLIALGAVAVLTFVYACALFVAGLIIGEVTPGETAAVATALVAWLVLCLLAVPGVAFIGRAMTPAPTRTLFEARRDETHQNLTLRARELLGAQLRQMTGPDAVPDDVKFAGGLRSALEASADEEIAAARRTLDHMDAEAHAALNTQRRVIEGLAWFSPGALFLDATASLVGTGSGIALAWNTAIERYHDALQPALFDRPPRMYLIVPSDKGPLVAFFDRRRPPTAGDLLRFEPPVDQFSARLRGGRSSTLLLLLYMGVGTGIAIARFRYRDDDPQRATARR